MVDEYCLVEEDDGHLDGENGEDVEELGGEEDLDLEHQSVGYN